MISKKTQWMVALSALSLMATVACGKNSDSNSPVGAVGANQCAAAYMNGYVNPALYPQCQPTNAYLYPNGQYPANGVYNGGYNTGYYSNWNAQAQWQAQWQWQLQMQQAYYNSARYYGSSCCPSTCWNYNGMYYGYNISGSEVLWKATPMSKEELEAKSAERCEHVLKAKLNSEGTLLVTDEKDAQVFTEVKVEAVAQKCDQVRYSKDGKLYQYDGATRTHAPVSSAMIEEQKDESALDE